MTTNEQKLLERVAIQQAIIDWNRGLQKPLIIVGMESTVIDAVIAEVEASQEGTSTLSCVTCGQLVVASQEVVEPVAELIDHPEGARWKWMFHELPYAGMKLYTIPPNIRELCMKVAKARDKASAMGYVDANYQVSDEEIVDKAIEEWRGS